MSQPLPAPSATPADTAAAAAPADPAAPAAQADVPAAAAPADPEPPCLQAAASSAAPADQAPPPHVGELFALTLPVSGNIDALEAVPSAQELRVLLERAVDIAQRMAAGRPAVLNLDKLARRIRADLDFVLRCCADGSGANGGGGDGGAGGGDGSKLGHAAQEAGRPGTPPPEQQDQEAEPSTGHTPPPQQHVEPLQAALTGDEQLAASGGHAAAPPKLRGPPLFLSPVRAQGCINNLRGFQGELLAAQLAPGVVGVLRRFQACVLLPPLPTAAATQQHAAAEQSASGTAGPQPHRGGGEGTPATPGAACSTEGATLSALASTAVAAAGGGEERLGMALAGSGRDGAATAAATAASEAARRGAAGPNGRGSTRRDGAQGGKGGAPTPTNVSVEVDVVAQDGHTWIEVKNQEVFGPESVHWAGAPRVKGLKRQVQELLAVAAAPKHARRWRAPSVVIFFPEAVHPGVADELSQMCAHVAVGPGALQHLPPPPPPPAATNLDVTAMCALVSELSHGGASDPAVEAWAQRTVHWVDCLAAERSRPLMAELGPWVAPDRPLMAADLACRQFQVLMDMFSGPRERERWAALQARMEVVTTEGRPQELSERVRSLLGGALGADQLAVFGLGDERRAVSLTANGNCVRSAERLGVCLEVVLHRPVWLTGR